MNTKSGRQEDRILAKSLGIPHMSSGGNAVCTNPKCKTRIARSNATIDMNETIQKALMFTNSTKIFVVEDGIVAECTCGSKYNVSDIFAKGIFFKKNR
jgi:hypothetical protein